MTTKQFNEALRNIRDKNIFEKFFDEYYPQIIKISVYLYHDYRDAQDVAQVIFKYFLTHETNNYVDNPTAWLFALCKYNGQKLFKKEVAVNDNKNYCEPIQQYLSFEMRNALAQLDEEEADIVVLVWFYGYKLGEVAAIVHKSYFAVAKQHERAKKKLKKLLSN